MNSTVRDGVVVAKETLVSAGALILKDTKEFEVYKNKASDPAKIKSDQLRKISYRT